MRSNPLLRLVTSRPFSAGNQDSFLLSREYDIAAVHLEFVGTIARTVAATTVSAMAPLQVFKTVEVKADGTRPFDQWDARPLGWGNFERALMSDLGVAPAVGIATDPIRCTLTLDRITPDANRPKDSALHTKDYMSLLEVVWNMGNPTDLYKTPGAMTNANATLAGTVNVYVEEIQEYDPRDAHEARLIKRCSRQSLAISAANSALLIPLSVNSLSRGVKLMALDTNNEPVNTLVNNVKLRSGVDVRLQSSWNQLRLKNQRDNKINDALFTARPGVAFADLLHNGNLNTLYSTVGKNEWFAELDVNAGPGTILLEHIEYMYQPAHPRFASVIPARKGGTAKAG